MCFLPDGVTNENRADCCCGEVGSRENFPSISPVWTANITRKTHQNVVTGSLTYKIKSWVGLGKFLERCDGKTSGPRYSWLSCCGVNGSAGDECHGRETRLSSLSALAAHMVACPAVEAVFPPRPASLSRVMAASLAGPPLRHLQLSNGGALMSFLSGLPLAHSGMPLKLISMWLVLMLTVGTSWNWGEFSTFRSGSVLN